MKFVITNYTIGCPEHRNDSVYKSSECNLKQQTNLAYKSIDLYRSRLKQLRLSIRLLMIILFDTNTSSI